MTPDSVEERAALFSMYCKQRNEAVGGLLIDLLPSRDRETYRYWVVNFGYRAANKWAMSVIAEAERGALWVWEV